MLDTSYNKAKMPTKHDSGDVGDDNDNADDEHALDHTANPRMRPLPLNSPWRLLAPILRMLDLSNSQLLLLFVPCYHRHIDSFLVREIVKFCLIRSQQLLRCWLIRDNSIFEIVRDPRCMRCE